MEEQWRFVAGSFTGYKYMVSNLGRVKSLRRPGKGVGRRLPRIMKRFPDKNGYLRVNLYDDAGMISQVPVHILVAEAFIGNRPEGMTVNHKDFDKCNNDPDNLEWITHQDNTEHARAAGRMKASTAKRLLTRMQNHLMGG